MVMSKVVIVSGGTRGIGLAITRRLVARGAEVVTLSRRGDELDWPNVTSMVCDVTDGSAVRSVVESVVERFGRLDAVIPNAGVGAAGRVTETASERFSELMSINVLGTFNLVKAAYPHLQKSPQPDIIAVVSEAGRRGFPEQTAYCASKFGQLGFMRSLDHEAREDGIRVTSICPGGVATEFAMGESRGRSPGMPGLGSMLHPDDVAYLVENALFAPRDSRVLEVVVRSSTEASWG